MILQLDSHENINALPQPRFATYKKVQVILKRRCLKCRNHSNDKTQNKTINTHKIEKLKKFKSKMNKINTKSKIKRN